MQPYFTYTVTCPCGWAYGPGGKTDIEQQVRWHKRDCEVWAK